LTNEQVQQLVAECIDNSEMVDGELQLKGGARSDIAKKFAISNRQVTRIWARAKKSRADPSVQAYRATPQKKGNSGRRPLYCREEVKEEIAQLPRHKRASIRAIAQALGIPKSTIAEMKRNEDVSMRWGASSAL